MEERQTQAKIVKYRKKKQFNIVFTVFVIVLIYLVVQIYFMTTKKAISIYEVGMAVENSQLRDYRGVITRTEKILTTEKEGYVNYYVREGRKIGKGATVYTTDETGEFSRMLAQTYTDGSYLSDTTISDLKARLFSLGSAGVNGDFQSVYQEKADLAATVMDSFLFTAMEELQSEQTEMDFPDSVAARESGYILFRTDNLEGLTPGQVTADTFREDLYQPVVYTGGERRPAHSFAYKLIPEDSFDITFLISQEDADRYQGRENLNIELNSLGVTVDGAFSIFTSLDGRTMATISLNKYGAQYLNDRFIDFKITEQPTTGYKIPVSSVITKSFFVIPKEYYTSGVEDKANVKGVFREIYDPSGNDTAEFVAVSMYAETDQYYYILSSDISVGDYLIQPDSPNRYQISVMAPLHGVYNVNRGYCIFRQVEIIDQTTDNNYYLIRTGTRFGLSACDRIVLNADLVEENQIIFQ